MSDILPGHRFRLHAPRVSANEVQFEWEVTPATWLYGRNGFRLTLPDQLDAGRVPYALWLRLGMLCLHVHWALLRPCRVELPFYIGPREREFWRRLSGHAAVQLEAYGAKPCTRAPVTLHDDGPTLAPSPAPKRHDRLAAAFSGGKDSLTQAGLLAELTERPLLVTTTSPVPWANDHLGAFRERVLSEITRRLPVDVAEVRSDFRACWDNGFAHSQQCLMTVNELTDVLLYQAATIAAAAAAGIPRALEASEADLQYNKSAGGEVIQHGHFAGSAVPHRAVSRLLGQFGLGLGSLTYPLHGDQVQLLLHRRYGQIADLQFSCWSAEDGEQACSECRQCYEIAIALLGGGISPRRAGIDPGRVLPAWAEWRPEHKVPTGPTLHPVRTPRDKGVRAILATPLERVAEILDDDPSREAALDGYRRVRARVGGESVPPHPGYIGALLQQVDVDLREPLRGIFDEHFEATVDPELAAMASRADSVVRWIADPLSR